MANIVVVEDNNFIREAIVGYLQLADHNTFEYGEIQGVIQSLDDNNIDLAILDVMLPDGNGFALAREIREKSDLPIIFLTAKDSESDRILGFEIGADDYVVKPFSSRELSLRVEALLKRYKKGNKEELDSTQWILSQHKLVVDKTSHETYLNEEPVHLTGAEWKILLYLSNQANIVVTRGRILTECLNYAFEGSERTVDTHIANLRSKLGQADWIGTIRGFGYRFNGNRI
ncbi:response regulator transcription factor [Spirochaeta cellobiosiphila]|uniref:response regulator transcription factor n=1 Tax=Spirochaeta cellobiosiphila TaxID=504483 RepID=UPI0003FB1A84|nr:response regulator transcription factor [Spirochaeta cellobiosiphila]